MAEQIGNLECLGRSFRARANALSVSGDNRAAAELHGRALDLLEAHGSPGEIARTLAAAIQPLILLGEYDRALVNADRARVLYESVGDEQQLARLEINVGNLHHRQDRGDRALECYERAHATGGRAARPTEPSTAPTAVAVFPAEIQIPLRHKAERTENLVRWTEFDRGGHFAAMEEPDLLLQDVREFFRQFRG